MLTKILEEVDFYLEAVAGEDDGLLVVAAQAALDHVQLQLQEVVQPRHLVLQQAHVVHVEPVSEKRSDLD